MTHVESDGSTDTGLPSYWNEKEGFRDISDRRGII
jgi:hypothetical protein